MNPDQANKPLALVTGASRGIGSAVASRLAQDGYHVLINFSSNEKKAQAVLDQIVQAGGSGELLGFNVGDSEQVTEKITAVTKEKGPISVLVNNAGINVDALLLRIKDADLDAVLDVNLKGAIYCCRAVSKSMMKARKGSIIQISSITGETGNAGQSVYSATKAALLGLTKSLAKELASRNIRVNAVTPGFVHTDMTEVLTEEQKGEILRNIPLGRIGQSEEIASVVSFLASDQSSYMTGQVLGVNGGMGM